uniref:Mitochondrial fission regulator n=1 Tax=Cyprinus carpio TaxID=7962 RepID=A0A8C2B8Z0_CYPCA
MSLLEDITDLLRCVLEYFGVPPDMLVPVWESTYCGQYRSIILLILRFIIPLQMFNLHADVLWLVEDEGDSHTKLRNAIPLRKAFEIPSLGSERSLSVSVPAQRGGRVLGQGTQPEALQKISALEEELHKLRTQIAMIVSAPAGPSILSADSGTPCSSPLPVPVLTSTPSAKREKLAQCGPSAGTVPAALPSMLEVLKDMNQVKRSVERSPGGTPVRRRRRSKGVAFSSDPAALIAKALKRNHNNRVMNCFLKKKIILLSEVHLRRSHGFCIKNIKI